MKFSINNGKFLTPKKYKIYDVMKLYEQSLEQHKNYFILDKINIHHNNCLKLAYNIWKEHGEIRCPLCGTKAAHFRINKNKNILLYCFRKSKFKNMCYYIQFNIDHILPKSKGGNDNKNNLTLTCIRCNTLKGNNIKCNTCVINTRNKIKEVIDNFFSNNVPRGYEFVFNVIKQKLDREVQNVLNEYVNDNNNFQLKNF